jgi:parallel beta-helix repeat protein
MANASDISRRDWVAMLGTIGGAVSFAALEADSPAQAWSGGSGVGGTRFLWVDTIKGPGTNLYSITGSDVDSNSTPAVIVGAHAAPNDCGGGTFYWDPTSSAGDNGGTIVVPTGSTPGRWIRQYSGAINANWFGASVPGADLGAVLNACDAAIGSSPGQIVVSLVNGIGTTTSPATLKTRAVIGANKAGRRVTLGPGVYAATTTPVTGEAGLHGAPWIIGDNSIFEGSGAGTILQESSAAPDGNAVSVIVAYGSIDVFATGYGNIIVRDLQVLGVPTNSQGSAVAAIYVANAQNVWVNQVTFTNTNALGVYAGGHSTKGGYASGIWITDCLFQGVYAQNCGVVNAYDFHIERNTFIGNNPNHIASNTFIDCEINSPGDRACFFTICDNVIDARPGAEGGHPLGISVQGGYSTAITDIGSGVISGNTCIGGELTKIGGVLPAPRMTQGIVLNNASNVTVTGNTMIRCYQAGIDVWSDVANGSQNNLIASNIIHGSDYWSIQLMGCSNNLVEGNVVSGNPTLGYGAGPIIHEISSPKGISCSNNTYKENFIQAYGSKPAQLITQGTAILINNYVGGVVASGNSGHGPAYRAASGSTTVTLSDYFVAINASSGHASISLPSAVHPGSAAAPSQGIHRALILKRSDASANTVTIVTTNGQTIDGAAPGTLAARGKQGATLRLISDGTNWLSW